MARTTPVACTLTPAKLATQGMRWKRLIARAMTERVETSDGLRICFRPEPGAEDELRAVVAVEAGCCPWAAWTVERDAGMIVLDVRSTAEGVATLHALAAAWLARPPPAATPPSGARCARTPGRTHG